MKRVISISFLSAFLCACATTATSVIVHDRYDQAKDLTVLTVAPYGQIEIEGEWQKTNYYAEGRQHFFKDKDSNSIAIGLSPMDQYPFYTKGISEAEFVRSFYEWEKEFYEKKSFVISELDSNEEYIYWKAEGEGTYSNLLYGVKDGYVYNLAIFESPFGESETKDFLVNLFKKN